MSEKPFNEKEARHFIDKLRSVHKPFPMEGCWLTADVLEDAVKHITHLEAQLAALKPATEAMGVLEEMLRDEQGDMRQLDIYYHPNAGYSVILTHANREELADGYSDDLIEAVLKAGGEGD